MNNWKQLTNASSNKKIWNSSQWLLSVCGEEEEDRKHWLPCSKTCCFVLVHLDKLCDFLIEITNLRITPNEASELCAIINFICLTWLNTLVAYPCMLKYAIWNFYCSLSNFFVGCVVLETEMFAANNISKTKILSGKRTNTGTELDKLKETHDSYKRTTFKDIGGENGVTVGFKTKSLKAVTVKHEILPRKLLKTIDKCKFKQENLELITVTVLYNCSQFVGRRRRRCAKSIWNYSMQNVLSSCWQNWPWL